MATNQELLAAAGEVLGSMGVRKSDAVMTTDNMRTGDFMDRTQVERLVDLTVSQSGWLSVVSLKMRSQRSGEIPRLQLNEVVTEGVPENAGQTVATVPTTDNVPYNCGKFQATWYVTVEDIREARASGEPDFDNKVRRAFAKAMGNDMARWALRGDTTLPNTTRINRLLRKRDGWLKQARTKAIRQTTGRGAPFAKGMFSSMLSAMPEEYRDDADLRWMYSSLLDQAWTETLADPTNAQGSELGDRATIERRRFAPLGIPQLILPQIPTDQGFAVVDASTADADAVVDGGALTVRATVNTLFGGFNAQWVGRLVRITYKGTGQSEVRPVVNNGGNLQITTLGSLGQAAIDLVPANYTLDLADLTTALLSNPLNLFIVMCDQIRAYRKFEQEFERWRVDVFYESDVGVFNEGALVVQDGVVTPQFPFGEGF